MEADHMFRLETESVLNILSFLTAEELELGPSLASSWLKGLCRDNLIWKNLCVLDWKQRRKEQEWLKFLNENADISPRKQFISRRKENIMTLPIFSMSNFLMLNQPTGLFLFEPRYRWLIQRTIEENNGPGIFVYATSSVAVGTQQWLVQVTDYNISADGSANVSLLPVAKCQLRELWAEEVPNYENVPDLYVGLVEELPFTRAIGSESEHRNRVLFLNNDEVVRILNQQSEEAAY